MSLHPSLKVDKAGTKVRSVFTRIERIKEIMKKGLWDEKSKVIALPKTKIVKVKARKKTKEEAEAKEGAAAAPAKDTGAKK